MTDKERYEYQKEIILKQREEINRQKAEIESLTKKYEMAVAEREANVKGFTDEIERLKNNILQNKWISVEDRLPEPFVSVLGVMTDAGEFPAVRECYTVGGKSFFFPALNDIHPVSHWMPMPEPMKEE